MNIREFCAEAGIVLAEASGGRFTGKITFEVNMRSGGLGPVHVTRTGEMRKQPEPNPSNGEALAQ